MDIVIASNNKFKVEEIKTIIGDYFDKVFTLQDLNLHVDTEETGSTFMENAIIKAKAVSLLTNLPALADDSGLEVDALDGAPGVYSARFAGSPCDDYKNNELLLSRLNNVLDRHADYNSAVALYFPDGHVLKATGKTFGIILQAPQGTNGFGYDPLFFSTELTKSFGEATAEEKNVISHRAKALRELKYQLSKHKKN